MTDEHDLKIEQLVDEYACRLRGLLHDQPSELKGVKAHSVFSAPVSPAEMVASIRENERTGMMQPAGRQPIDLDLETTAEVERLVGLARQTVETAIMHAASERLFGHASRLMSVLDLLRQVCVPAPADEARDGERG